MSGMSGPPDLEAALAEATRWLDEVPGVVGIGQGEEQGAPTVDVWTTDASQATSIPRQLHGVRVRIQDSDGPFQAYEPAPE